MDTENSVQETAGIDAESSVQDGGKVTTGEKSSGDDGKAKYEALLKQVEGMEKTGKIFQSEKDKAVKRAAEAEAEAKALKRQVDSLRKQYQDDPEFSAVLDRSELEGYRSKDKSQADLVRQQQEMAEWGANMRMLLDDIGVKYDHPELATAAAGARSPFEAQRMIISKAKEIKTRERKGGNVNNDALARLKEEILAELRKDQGLDTSENLPPVGTAGKIYSSESVAKMSPEQFVKEEAEINRAIAEGRFKK